VLRLLHSRWLWLPLLAINLWAAQSLIKGLGPIPVMLITAALLAFILAQPVALLIAWGLKRSVALSIVFGLMGLAIVLLAGLLIPLFFEQLKALISGLPLWIQSEISNLQQLDESLDRIGVTVSLEPLQDWLRASLHKLAARVGREGPRLVGSGVGMLLHLVLELFLVLFLLLGGRSQVVWLLGWIPLQARERLISTSDRVLRTYFGGWTVTAVLYGIALWLVLSLLRIPYALVFAVLVSTTTLVPYAGAIAIFLLSALLMLVAPAEGLRFFLGAILSGQVIDHTVYPLLMNRIFNFPPVSVILIVLLGGQVFSFLGLPAVLGLLLALPIAATLRELLQDPPLVNEPFPQKESKGSF
jgi:predicted PurR-regulated permease PerM